MAIFFHITPLKKISEIFSIQNYSSLSEMLIRVYKTVVPYAYDLLL